MAAKGGAAKVASPDKPVPSEAAFLRSKALAIEHWPVLVGLAAFAWFFVGHLTKALAQNGGHLAYGLDDAYIHLAMARSLSEAGVFGITPYEFTSSGSSLLWVLVLAAFNLIFGVHEWPPLFLNIVAAGAFLLLGHLLMRRFGVSPWTSALTMVGLVYFTPMSALVISGMEHMTQAALDLAFLTALVVRLRSKSTTWTGGAPLAVLAALVGATRYEGLFLVVAVGGWLLLEKRWRDALAVVGAGFAPAVVYGLVSLANGWSFLPNSVFLKTMRPDYHTGRGVYNLLLFTPYVRFLAVPHTLIVFAGTLALFLIKGKQLDGGRRALLGAVAATTYLHLQFGSSGWFFRYEAYLVALGLVVMVCAMAESFRPDWRVLRRLGVAMILAFLLFSSMAGVALAERAMVAQRITARASTNIYEQQYQMGLFVAEYYQGETVAINDIGAVSFLGDSRIIDLAGLADRDIGNARWEGRYNGRIIEERAASARIAILYIHWFQNENALPASWTEVGRWAVDHNVILGGHEVTFFAVDPAEVDPLTDHLREFAPRLPATVHQSGNYTKA